jgi:hypothetical protein
MNVSQQRWDIRYDGTIRSRYSNKCLTVDDLDKNGQVLVMRSCDGSDQQKWHTLPVDIPTVETGGGRILHWNNKCMYVEHPSQVQYIPVKVGDCTWYNGNLLDLYKFVTVKTKEGSFRDRWSAATDKSSLCFSDSSCKRWEELVAVREELLKRNHIDGAIYLLDHDGIGRVVDEIAKLPNYSTTEQVFVWTTIASEGLKNATLDYPYYFDILEHEAHPLVINADILGPENTRAHTVVSFWDDYHGYLIDFTLQDAFNMIWDKEHNKKSMALCLACWPWCSCPNHGDISASLRSVIAMQAFQRTNSFDTFASYWNGLQRKNGADWCPERIYTNGCDYLDLPALQ